ncbi:DUF1093 domain-containing protein [Bacillus sonorensis]|uniref:YxeA family protein n=2 Tax=Bacillus sonorensis TaxID=119858 RepID=M5P611_9BACI|nr:MULTISPECIES: DUF1093 domain-containing protein [Bacillus]TWK74714.1 hypothetical protein CHCC20335_3128 [Bacillus paralicheniformis]ASB87386.1 hypothetical protein S101395_00832 [Bacillus sonorensis]EME75421.1 hypothetical protein BSONL12_06273 [Bacillus sonorensis L12]MBG9913794.1 hypothetical protein [Bacillus sonorensis]MCF7616849.1 YxeA family protein [Bacillus sonorensis]
MKNITFFVMILGCLSAFILGGCAEKGAVLESDFYVQIHGKAEQAGNKKDYVYNVEGINEDGKKKVVSFFVDKPCQEGTLVRVPRRYDGYTGKPNVIKAEDLPEKLKEQFHMEK